MNDCYPEKAGGLPEGQRAKTISYEDFLRGIETRGFDTFEVPGEQIRVDTTDFSTIDMKGLFSRIAAGSGRCMADAHVRPPRYELPYLYISNHLTFITKFFAFR